MTDDSGGRTEIIRSARDLDPATVGIADELSKQYYLGYQVDRKTRRPVALDSSRAEELGVPRARPPRLHRELNPASD